MKLNDLISALADEIEIIRPELQEHLEELIAPDTKNAEFSEAAEFYTEQTQRMGEAAEMVGFPGLQGICEHVRKNIEQLTEEPEHERSQYSHFLQKWPDLVVYYLKNLSDPSAAAGLVDFLRTAPVAIEEEEALRIMHKLGAFPSAMESLEESSKTYRPVLAQATSVALDIPKDVEQSLLDGFFQEAPQQTERLIKLLNNMVAENSNPEELAEAKRIVHTLKGTGAIIGISGLANLGHHFEDILEYFESQQGQIESKVATVLLDGGHCLSQMIAYLMEADDYPNQALSVYQNILDLANMIDHDENLDNIAFRNQVMPNMAPVTTTTVSESNSAKKKGALRIGLERIEKLFQTSAQISVHASAMEAQIKNLSEFSNRLRLQQLKVKKRLFELETIVDVRSLSMMKGRDALSTQENFDPLELEQYNELHSTTHALLEEFNDAILVREQIENNFSSLSTLENQYQVLARDLQHLVIGTRMSEVGSLEPRLQRNVRTTCQMTGKQAQLILTGGETLIDSDVLSELAAPLLHLLRNAIDHGIESEEERLAVGKDPVGNIKLNFSAQGQQIMMTCEDDGRGLNYERILKRSIENGLVTEDESLAHDEIAKLIFMSGFSTRDEVSEVSGRGVGLDVVKNWLNTVNGNIEITSDFGQNTVMKLQFASSLTTVQSLIVETAKQAFALPSVQVVQALSHDEGSFVESNKTLQYHHNEKIYAAKHLSDMLGFERHTSLDEAFAVLIRVGDEQWALAVERLIDSRELLLKQPGNYIQHVSGIIGTSILGDGSIAIHLDIPQLLTNKSNYQATHKTKIKEEGQNAANNTPSVLVVDDSLSVRNTLQELMEDAGFTVKTARDGMDAANILEDYRPHLVLTDLEMPNMNGVELTSHIRGRTGFEKLPIIMITSRSQDKHRKLALDAGVDNYFTKPYNDVELLKAVHQMIN